KVTPNHDVVAFLITSTAISFHSDVHVRRLSWHVESDGRDLLYDVNEWLFKIILKSRAPKGYLLLCLSRTRIVQKMAESELSVSERANCWMDIEGDSITAGPDNESNHHIMSGIWRRVGSDDCMVCLKIVFETPTPPSPNQVYGVTLRGIHCSILCIWESCRFSRKEVIYVTISDNFIAIYGTWLPSNSKILFIVVYAPQQATYKRCLWDYLSTIIGRWNGESIVMGDFNDSFRNCALSVVDLLLILMEQNTVS
ncbi:RNA-directed DNA polymerase, eukaryota, partial [Tanacetum coccineum]